jgi:succinyl-diaminopimelate desuccinylase
MSVESIFAIIEQNKDVYIEFLRSLIQSDSFNPPGNEKNVALVIEDFLKDKGIKTEIFPFGDNRANMFAFLNDNFTGKNLLYNGHMDVVPPGSEADWKYPPLSAYIKRNKYIYGRGTADMKAALAAMIVSITILKKIGIKTSGNLIVNAVADEETGGKLGTGWCLDNVLKKRSIKCDFVLVGEASGVHPLPKAIVLGEKGHLIIKLVTSGKSAHSMAPSMGKNAIYMMSRIIENFDDLEKYLPKIDPPFTIEELKEMVAVALPPRENFDRIYNDQPLLRSMTEALTRLTKSINMISGGIKANVIPDRCEVLIDFRLFPGQTSQMIINGLKKLITDIGFKVNNATTENLPGEVYLEIYSDGESSVWEDYNKSQTVKEFKKIVENTYGKKSFFFLSAGGTDSKYYRNSGYCKETIHFGPGNVRQMHATNENLELQDFFNSIKVYTLFAYNFLSKK